MIIGIDASNIRFGGGVTHLVELLAAADPASHRFSQIIVWGGRATLAEIADRPWLSKRHEPMLDADLLRRVLWQRVKLSGRVNSSDCDVLFVPGGSYAGNFRATVAMSQNLLPFDWREARRFGWSIRALKMIVLRWTQSQTFRRSDGVVFLTRFGRDKVMQIIGAASGKTVIIPHGVSKRFARPPGEQLPIDRFSIEKPFRILYVSVIDVYKHQWHVAEAVAQLRRNGFPVLLELVGPANAFARRRLIKTLDRIDPSREVIRYTGNVPHAELHSRYAEANLFVFASSCETFGQILTEAMSAGLPIACSNRSAMPELLGEAGVYFDPENVGEIVSALTQLIESPELRKSMAMASFDRVQAFSWHRCADETMNFLADVAGAQAPNIPQSGKPDAGRIGVSA